MSASIVIVAIYWMCSATLVLAGAVKLARPVSLATLLSARVPRPRVAARLLGLVEVGAGSAALYGAPGAPFAVAAVYLGLALGAEFLLRTGANGSCGCFGSAGGRLTVGHVIFDVAGMLAALGAGTVALLGSREVPPLLVASPPLVVLLGLQLAFAAWLAARLLGDLPETWNVWNNPFAVRGG